MTMHATVDSNGVVTGFYSSDVHSKIPEGAIQLTDAQYRAWVANTNGQKWSGGALVAHEAAPYAEPLVPSAMTALIRSDRTILRCVERGVAVPADWVTYRTELRAIAAGTSAATQLPAPPPYPAGT